MLTTAMIPNHYGFMATTSGEIIGKRGKPLKGHIDRCGYREVLLSENGKTKSYLAHRLILLTFKPIADPHLYDVNHKNGDKLDNRIENLEWCTRSENVLHAYRTGLEKKQLGEKHHAHKLSQEAVEHIRATYKRYDRECGAAALARLYGVDKSTVQAVINNETWRN